MKLLVVVLCLAAGPESFVLCEHENISYLDGIDMNREETMDGEASMEKIGQMKNNLGERALAGNNDAALEPNKTDSALDALKIDVKALRDENGDALKYDDLQKALVNLDIGGRALRQQHGGDVQLKFGDGGRFVAGRNDVLGEGFAGKVYKAIDTMTGRQVAVKTELKNAKKGKLMIESQNYEIIGDQRGIPHIYYSGTSRDRQSRVLVMQMLANSLGKLQEERINQQFSPKTVYMLGIQLMYRIELIHKKRLVHRDIKPRNFGIDNAGQQIYIYDFGSSKKYVDDQGRHIPEGPITPDGSGDPRYRSWYAHSHRTQSRRDDLEAIGFMLMAFLRGHLPWDAVHDDKQPAYKSQVLPTTMTMKENLDFGSFCNGYARQMVDYFKHIRNDLKFSTKPNYSYLRKLFRAALLDMGEKEDYKFDWSTT